MLDYRVKHYINQHSNIQKDIHFSISRLRFLVTIYGDPTAADEDRSRILSVKEALTVAAAMSLDSIVAGIGAADWGLPVPVVFCLALLVGTVSVLSGCRIGSRLAGLRGRDISWVSGLILILLAVWRM